MIDLHRHTEFSTFDGFGKARELAMIAAEMGYTGLGVSEHGNTNSLVQHYLACKENKIKPVMGCEGYFLPKYKEKTRGFHLCLFAKNIEGYANLNKIQYAGEKQKYYNPIWTFKELKQYHKGLIATSACVGGYLAQCILKNNMDMAAKYVQEMKAIFKDDFYIEIQPYKVTEKNMQEKVNVKSYYLARKYDVKMILTSDSHMGRKSDIDSYIKLHEIAKHDIDDIVATYSERYMPTETELVNRFVKMHDKDFKDARKLAAEMIGNLDEIENKVDGDILDKLELKLPQFDENKNSLELLKAKVKQGLKERGKLNREYVERAKHEISVIDYHDFTDYFLIVADYVNFAKNAGITVGAGRGSGCNCLVNYALKITDVDPILLDLDFNRFLRKDKKKMPDIDIDFETDRRGEVIDYLLNKYKNNAAQICSYGLYKVDNLINDLVKVCGVPKNEVAGIKALVKDVISDGVLDGEKLQSMAEYRRLNREYDNILKHFIKLYMKVRFIGTHAAGVAITSKNILEYTAVRIDGKTGKHFTNYNLDDLENIQVIKFDLLGLRTLSNINELRKLTGITCDYDEIIKDEKVISEFGKGNCDGIFQFENRKVHKMLEQVACSNFDDIVAASAMNRPGPLSLKMPAKYAENKANPENIDYDKVYSRYYQNTHGCIIYQEQIQNIAVNIGGLSWPDADKLIKMERGGTTKNLKMFNENYDKFFKIFKKGAAAHGLDEEEALNLFDNFFNYSFNKGHATGYSLLSVEEMFYKVYYPVLFWYIKLKYCNLADDAKLAKFKENAIQNDVVMFLPHCNYTAYYSLRKVDGETVIQEGLTNIKGIGVKAAEFIENERKKNGIFTSYDNFYDRCKNRAVTSRVVDILKENGALEFNKKKYIKRVTNYNATLYGRQLRSNAEK